MLWLSISSQLAGLGILMVMAMAIVLGIVVYGLQRRLTRLDKAIAARENELETLHAQASESAGDLE